MSEEKVNTESLVCYISFIFSMHMEHSTFAHTTFRSCLQTLSFNPTMLIEIVVYEIQQEYFNFKHVSSSQLSY